MPDTAFAEIPIEQLHESPWNPRRRYDPAALADLTASVRAVGILTPLLVRPNAAGYEIAAGHRRFRAACAAGLTVVPAHVRALDDAAMREVLIIENLQRADVDPLDEAQGFRTLLDASPATTIEDLASRVGRSASYIYQRLRLLQLVEPAQRHFEAGAITLAHAQQLARLTPAQQKALLLWLMSTHWRERPSPKALADRIHETFFLRLSEAQWKLDDASLVPAAGACTTCPKRSGASPELFADLAKADTCTDRACFESKRQTWLTRRVTDLQAKSADLVRVSLQYDFYDPMRAKAMKAAGILPARGYEAVKKGTPGAVPAVVVDTPYEEDQLGKQIWVRVPDAGASTARRASTNGEAKWRQKRQREEAVKVAALRAMVAQVESLETCGLETVVVPALLDYTVSGKTQEALWRELTGVTPPERWKAKPSVAELEALSGQALARVLLTGALWASMFGHAPKEVFTAAVRRFRINLKQIAREVAAAKTPRAARTKTTPHRRDAKASTTAGRKARRAAR